MAENVIIMVGDGMGWEMARAAAIAKAVQEGHSGDTLEDFYTEGKGEGLSFQQLEGYQFATTYGTTIADEEGRFSTGDSALDESNPMTGASPVREGFEFNPAFNPGTENDGGATVEEGAEGNLVGYDPERGGVNPWTPGSDPEYIKHSYPDSANTATTLYTGVKSYNNATGVNIFEQDLETIFETASKEGKATGLVSSVPIDHATPGAGYSAVNRRSKYDGDFPALDNILQQGLRETKPTVLLGGGHPLDFENETAQGGVLNYEYITESTYNELSQNPDSNIYGYKFLERGANAGETLLETAAQIDPNTGERLLGLYGARGQNGNIPTSSADGDYSTTGLDNFSVFGTTSGDAEDQTPEPDTVRPLMPGETDEAFIAKEVNENPTLSEMTQASLDVLGKDEDGFTLMVEGGDIDWAAHDDNMDNLIGNTLEFDKAVQTVIDWIEENGGFEENQLIITADHDHYLTLNDNFPQLLREKGAEALTLETDPNEAGHYWGSDPDIKFGWGSHTNRPVPVYFQGEGTQMLDEFVGQGYKAYGEEVPGIEGLIDQTHIYQTMYAGITDGADPVTQPSVPESGEIPNEIPETSVQYGEAGGDVLDVDANEIVFGGDGNDLIDASLGRGGNRIFGRDGNDILLGGFNDILVGDLGDDALYAGNGGSTLIGGEGTDQFWVANGSLPESGNIIRDFTIGEDVIGFSGLSEVSDFESLSLVQSGSDTRVVVNDLAIAILEGIQADTLTSDSFAFA
jgi:alkaline phosphatase